MTGSAPRGEGVQGSRDHRFGASPPFSLGVEEELLLVDERGQLIAVADAVLDDVAGPLAERISARGSRGGLWPARIRPAPGRRLGRSAARRQTPLRGRPPGLRRPAEHAPCGLHVHVGAPDPETAVRLANAFRLYLPMLQALSANSPFREGADSGNASSRSSVVRSYPRFQLPRHFRDYEEFRQVADQLVGAAGVDDYTYIWWDVRPHPKLGTVEVRAVDVQTDVLSSAAIAALVQAIAAKELDRPTAPVLYREALEESYFQAASHGLDAVILFDEDAPRPAREVGRNVVDLARPYARELGGDGALDEIQRILEQGNGADAQRQVHRESGMVGLLERLTEARI